MDVNKYAVHGIANSNICPPLPCVDKYITPFWEPDKSESLFHFALACLAGYAPIQMLPFFTRRKSAGRITTVYLIWAKLNTMTDRGAPRRLSADKQWLPLLTSVGLKNSSVLGISNKNSTYLTTKMCLFCSHQDLVKYQLLNLTLN